MKKGCDPLEKWRPRGGQTQMTGAAAALLAVKGSQVILHSPRWCALQTEAFLKNALPRSEERLFCTQTEEETILFGAEKNLRNALKEASVKDTDAFLAVLLNNTESLIGDDVEGICTKYGVSVPIISLDAGGMSGSYRKGWSDAMLCLFQKFFIPQKVGENKTVNLIGVDGATPFGKETGKELKRLLSAAGVSAAHVFSDETSDLESLSIMGNGIGNIVVNEGCGIAAAEYLQEKGGMPFIVAPVPYGISQTVSWVKKVCAYFGIRSDLRRLLEEADFLAEHIYAKRAYVQQSDRHAHMERILISADSETALSLGRALREEFPAASVYIHGDGMFKEKEFGEWNPLLPLPPLSSQGYQILIGSEEERYGVYDTDRTVFLNISSSSNPLRLFGVCLAGMRGWAFLMKSVLDSWHSEILANRKHTKI